MLSRLAGRLFRQKSYLTRPEPIYKLYNAKRLSWELNPVPIIQIALSTLPGRSSLLIKFRKPFRLYLKASIKQRSFCSAVNHGPHTVPRNGKHCDEVSYSEHVGTRKNLQTENYFSTKATDSQKVFVLPKLTKKSLIV